MSVWALTLCCSALFSFSFFLSVHPPMSIILFFCSPLVCTCVRVDSLLLKPVESKSAIQNANENPLEEILEHTKRFVYRFEFSVGG